MLLRYGDIEQQPLCVLATVLDPRFKLKVFSIILLIQECELWLSNFSYGGSKPGPQRAKADTQPTDKQSLADSHLVISMICHTTCSLTISSMGSW